MSVKGWIIGLTLTGALSVAALESCSDTVINEAEEGRDKSTQFFGNTGKNFVENSAAFVEDGAEALVDYLDDKLPDSPEGVGEAGVRGAKKVIDTVGRVFDGAVREALKESEGSYGEPDCDDPEVMALTLECWQPKEP